MTKATSKGKEFGCRGFGYSFRGLVHDDRGRMAGSRSHGVRAAAESLHMICKKKMEEGD